MSLLSPRLQLRVAQKQILTPGLVQMVTVLQLNRLELKEMINQEIAQNPVLEESAEMGDDMTPEEVQALIERERARGSCGFRDSPIDERIDERRRRWIIPKLRLNPSRSRRKAPMA